jgi:hypothetical protein
MPFRPTYVLAGNHGHTDRQSAARLSTISMNYREMKIGYAAKSELAVKQGQVDR